MLRVTLRQIEVFLAIVEEGSFAGAADRLDIAQPSVSAHVQAIERQVGGPLFLRRRGRRPELTEFGRRFRDQAGELMREAAVLADDVGRHRHEAGGRVVFACQRTLAHFALRRDLADFARLHPEFRLSVEIGSQEDVIRLIRDGTADIGLFLGNENVPRLAAEVVGRDRLVLIAGAGHRLAGRRRIAPAEIAACPFVSSPDESMFGRAIARLLAGIGILRVETVARATEYHLLRELVGAGIGIACSPESNVQADLALGTIVVLDVDAPELYLDIRRVLSPRRPPSPAVDTFRTFLAERLPLRLPAGA